MEQQGSKDSLVRSILISIGLFIFGDKITVVAEISLRLYDRLSGATKTKPEFLLEMTLIGLAVGVSLVVYLTSLKKEHDPREDHVILAGAAIGIIAGLLEISKAALSDSSTVADFSFRAYFFFGIYLFIFVAPIIPSVLRSSYWIIEYKSFFEQISKVLLTSIIVAVIVQLFIGWLVIKTNVIESTYPIEHAGKELIYNPLSFVILASLINFSAFSFSSKGFISARFFKTWVLTYLVLAMLFSICYFMFFALEDNPPLINENAWITAFYFACLSITPMIAEIIYRYFGSSLRFYKRFIFKVSLYYSLTIAAMFLGLAKALTEEFYASFLISCWIGICGAAIAIVSIISERKSLAIT